MKVLKLNQASEPLIYKPMDVFAVTFSVSYCIQASIHPCFLAVSFTAPSWYTFDGSEMQSSDALEEENTKHEHNTHDKYLVSQLGKYFMFLGETYKIVCHVYFGL